MELALFVRHLCDGTAAAHRAAAPFLWAGGTWRYVCDKEDTTSWRTDDARVDRARRRGEGGAKQEED